VLFSCYKSTSTRDFIEEKDINANEDIQETLYDPITDFPQDNSADEINDTDIEETITAQEFCSTLAYSICGYFESCCTPQERDILLQSENLDCREPITTEFFFSCISSYGEGIESGKIVVTPEGMREMAEELNTLTTQCPNLGESPLVKEYYYNMIVGKTLIGQLPEGTECIISEECLEELFCDIFSQTCRERVRTGGVCREDSECHLGEVCIRGRCNQPGQEGDRCQRFEDCSYGLRCNNGFCSPMLESGIACSPGEIECRGFCPSEPPYICIDFCNGI